MRKLSILAGIMRVMSGDATSVYADTPNSSDFTFNGSMNFRKIIKIMQITYQRNCGKKWK